MVLCAHIMRIALVFATFTCGATGARAFPADNIPYCSDGFEKPAKIVFNSGQMIVTIGEETTEYSAHEPIDGVDGIIFVGDESTETGERIKGDVYAVKLGDDEVILFENRVFWPCETK